MLMYQSRQQSIQSNCSRIQPGMRQAEVISLVENGIFPREERIYEGHLAFAFENGGCVVEIDPSNGRVLKTTVDLSLRVLTPGNY